MIRSFGNGIFNDNITLDEADIKYKLAKDPRRFTTKQK